MVKYLRISDLLTEVYVVAANRAFGKEAKKRLPELLRKAGARVEETGQVSTRQARPCDHLAPQGQTAMVRMISRRALLAMPAALVAAPALARGGGRGRGIGGSRRGRDGSGLVALVVFGSFISWLIYSFVGQKPPTSSKPRRPAPMRKVSAKQQRAIAKSISRHQRRTGA